MSDHPDYVAPCAHCGAPSDGGPCDECHGTTDHDDAPGLVMILDRLPVFGGPANGRTVDAALERVELYPSRIVGTDTPELTMYVRRPFIIADPSDADLANMLVVFVPEEAELAMEGIAFVRAGVIAIAILAGWWA